MVLPTKSLGFYDGYLLATVLPARTLVKAASRI